MLVLHIVGAPKPKSTSFYEVGQTEILYQAVSSLSYFLVAMKLPSSQYLCCRHPVGSKTTLGGIASCFPRGNACGIVHGLVRVGHGTYRSSDRVST